MARYSKEHKEASKVRIVQAAAELFRKNGYNGVGIDEVCSAAGLTRGTFYSHFNAKAELLAAVLNGAHDFLRRLHERRGKTASVLRSQGVKVARDYLTPKHRSAVLGGCSLSSLAMEVARGEPDGRAAYAAAVHNIVDEFMRERPQADRQQVQAALALCIGGLLMSSACGADPIGDQISRAARQEVTRLLG